MHARGIVHGDLHPGNIVLCIPGLESYAWTVDTIYEAIGQPQTVSLSDLHVRGHQELPSPSQHLHLPEYLLCRPPLSEAILSLCLGFSTVKIMLDEPPSVLSSRPTN
ncbi:hypothetical protein BDD12DRAFT_936564 [Trichophaea hybrida]|nr:hypothetical protein BDD12DRAFT_936564 [Trichophaea hybrida]